jgi:putative hydrolase of the HAD superfamily
MGILEETSARFDIPVHEILKAYIAAAREYELGKIPSEVFVRNFLANLGGRYTIDPALVLELPVRAWSVPDPEMLALVRRLRKHYRTALLSNNIHEVVEKIREKVDLDGLFDVVVFSNEAGVRKPDPAIFALCLKKLGVAPEEAVFIDNHENLCEGAEAAGIRAILFTGKEKLLQDLTALNVIVD